MRDRKLASGCRLAPRVSAFSRSRSETNGFGGGGLPRESWREKENPGRRAREREGGVRRERGGEGKCNTHVRPGREILGLGDR